MLIICCLDI